MTANGTPVARRASRLLVVDELKRILLLSAHDPSAPEVGSWWFTPGGGVEPGESSADAARREADEEIGLLVGELGAPVYERHASFDIDGVHFEQDDSFFVVRVDRHEVNGAGRTDDERRVLTGHRWWSLDELRATGETVYPLGFVEILEQLGILEDRS